MLETSIPATTARRSAMVVIAAAVLLAPLAALAVDRILVIGDGTATGVSQRAWVAWTSRLERSEGVKVQIWGGPDASVADPSFGMASMPECPAADAGIFGVQAAILSLGTNDYGRAVPLAQVRAGVRTLLRAVRTDWICITPPGRTEETARNGQDLVLQDYRDAIAAECEAEGAVIIHGEIVVPSNSTVPTDATSLGLIGHRRMFLAVRDVVRGF